MNISECLMFLLMIAVCLINSFAILKVANIQDEAENEIGETLNWCSELQHKIDRIDHIVQELERK